MLEEENKLTWTKLNTFTFNWIKLIRTPTACISVLTNDITMDTRGGYLKFLSNKEAESGRVQVGSTSKHPVLWQTA